MKSTSQRKYTENAEFHFSFNCVNISLVMTAVRKCQFERRIAMAQWLETHLYDGEPNNATRVEKYMIASAGKWNDVEKDNGAITG